MISLQGEPIFLTFWIPVHQGLPLILMCFQHNACNYLFLQGIRASFERVVIFLNPKDNHMAYIHQMDQTELHASNNDIKKRNFYTAQCHSARRFKIYQCIYISFLLLLFIYTLCRTQSPVYNSLLKFGRDSSRILHRSQALTLPRPWVPGEVSSPLLSENRWNQIKTAGNEGNGFWVVWADRTGPEPD